jgi:hypothetical protein
LLAVVYLALPGRVPVVPGSLPSEVSLCVFLCQLEEEPPNELGGENEEEERRGEVKQRTSGLANKMTQTDVDR